MILGDGPSNKGDECIGEEDAEYEVGDGTEDELFFNFSCAAIIFACCCFRNQ